jgi:hypothetical protein
MKPNMPLVTLLTGAALGVGVLVASVLSPASTSAASTSPYGATSTPSPASAGTVTASVPLASSPAAATATATSPAASPSSSTATAPAAGTSTAPAIAPTATAPANTAPANTAPANTAPAATASAGQAYVPPKADYVSQLKGGAAVAVSVHGDKATAYICNGHAVAAWLKGTAKDGKLNLTGSNGARLQVSYRKSKAAGYIMADGTKYMFSAPLVHKLSSDRRPPGLYRATAMVQGVPIKAGWIVLPNGTQVGSVEYDPDSAIPPTAQAPVLDLATGTAQYDGITLVATLVSGITGSGF